MDGFEGVDVGAGELYRAAGGDVDADGQRGDRGVVDIDQVEGAGADPLVDVIDGGVGDGGGCGVDAGGAAGDTAVEDLMPGLKVLMAVRATPSVARLRSTTLLVAARATTPSFPPVTATPGAVTSPAPRSTRRADAESATTT